MKKNKLLLIVDPQYDFIEGGNLPVNGAKAKMDALGKYIENNAEEYSYIVITTDWHTFTHCSFTEQGGEWPTHCVEYTHGAAIYNAIMKSIMSTASKKTIVLRKGDTENKDEYSVLQNKASGTWLLELLVSNDFEGIDVCGICGDVCVLNTISDLNAKGFGKKVTILEEYTPSLDGGSKLQEFAKENNIPII